MKIVKILSAILVIVMLSSTIISCGDVKIEYGVEGCFEKKEENNNTDQGAVQGEETRLRHKVKAHLRIVDYNNKELYATAEEDPFEYDSAYFEPTVVKFIQNYADMNDKKISCKIADNGLISSISITKKGQTKDYKAEASVISQYDGSTQKTYWVCYINGEMVSSMKDTLVKDGDVVELHYIYPDWNTPTITTAPESTAELIPESTPAEE